MLIWVPKRGERGGWSFYSVAIPFSLILIMLVLVVLLALHVFGALR